MQPFHAVSLLALVAAALPPAVARAQIRTGPAIEVTSEGPHPGTPAVAIQDDGSFIVAWENRESFGRGNEGVRFQRFDAAGAKVGAAVELSDRGVILLHSHLRGPAIAADGAGGFVVAWEDGSDSRLRVQRFGASGVALAPARRVDRTDTEQCHPSIAMGRDGGFALAWLRRGSAFSEIVMRRFDPAGSPLGETLAVDGAPNHLYTGHRLHDPRLAMAADGGITIVWSHPDGYVGMRRYDRNGVPEGPPRAASSAAFTGDPPRPAIALASDGRFVVAWTPGNAHGPAYNSPYGVWVRAFDTAGNALGDEFRINGGIRQADSIDVAVTPDGGFVATWITSTPDGSAVQGRRLDANGQPLGGESVFAAARSAGHQAMAMGVAGDFVVVADGRYGSERPVAQRLRVGELPVLSLGHLRATIIEGESVRIPVRVDRPVGVAFWLSFVENTDGFEREHRRHFSESATQRRLFEFASPSNTSPQPVRQYTVNLFPPSSGVAAVAPDAGTARVTVLDDD